MTEPLAVPALAFFPFAGLAILCALFVVFKPNPVTAAFNLVITFVCFGAMYALLGAHLVAILQVLVYTGAIMVLFIFVIMLLNATAPSVDLVAGSLSLRAAMAGIATIGLIAFMVRVFLNSELPTDRGGMSLSTIEGLGGNSRVLSELMFSKFVLPFELTSVLLLSVIVGVVAIALRNRAGGNP